MNKLILAAATTALGLASANAAVISYPVNFGPTTIGAAAFNVTLPKFDPALGYLSSVKITLDATTSDNVLQFDNEAAGPGTVTLQVGTEVTATSPSLSAIVATPVQSGSGSVDGDNDGPADFLGTDSFEVSGGSGNDSDSQTGSTGPILAAYTATFLGETFSTTISNDIFTSTSTSGIFGPTNPTAGQFAGTLTVEYTYTIPEPSSIALVGLTAAGALLRRRRN